MVVAGTRDPGDERWSGHRDPLARHRCQGGDPEQRHHLRVPQRRLGEGSTKPTRPAGVVAAKAIIAAPTRTACSVANCGAGNAQLDWALRPNQHYVREDGAYVFLTDANGIFTAYPAEHDLGSSLNFWDGLNADWTTRGPSCNNWTSTADNGPSASTSV